MCTLLPATMMWQGLYCQCLILPAVGILKKQGLFLTLFFLTTATTLLVILTNPCFRVQNSGVHVTILTIYWQQRCSCPCVWMGV